MRESALRIMVVEDNVTWCQFIHSMFRNGNGCRIISAVSDGQEAIEKAADLKPDIILLDIGLPTVNGIEVARRIASVAPQSKILFLSENRDSEVIQEALTTGACGYVVKSRAASELLPAINAVLSGGTFLAEQLTSNK